MVRLSSPPEPPPTAASRPPPCFKWPGDSTRWQLLGCSSSGKSEAPSHSVVSPPHLQPWELPGRVSRWTSGSAPAARISMRGRGSDARPAVPAATGPVDRRLPCPPRCRHEMPLFPPNSQTKGGRSGPGMLPSSQRQALWPGEACLCRLTPSPRCAGLPRPPPAPQTPTPIALPSRRGLASLFPRRETGPSGKQGAPELASDLCAWTSTSWGGQAGRCGDGAGGGDPGSSQTPWTDCRRGQSWSCRPVQPSRVKVALVIQDWSAGQCGRPFHWPLPRTPVDLDSEQVLGAHSPPGHVPL